MPTTSKYGFPYPSLGSTPNVPADMQALAEAIEATVGGLITDTGDKTDLTLTAGSGWSVDGAEYRVILGKIMQLNAQVSRTGGTVTAQSNGDGHPGNIGDEDLFTITDTAYRPTTSVETWGHGTTTGGSVRLKPSGLATLYDMHTNSTIEQGDIVSLTFVYFIP